MISVLLGTVTKNDLDKISSSSEGLQVKGKSAYSDMKLTIEGVGSDACIKDFGILVRNAANVEIRNLSVLNFMDDGISIDTSNCNIWFIILIYIMDRLVQTATRKRVMVL